MPHHEDDDLAEDTTTFLRRKRKEALPPDSKCYTLPNGECISPLDCMHGDGLPLEEFLKLAGQHESHDARFWYTLLRRYVRHMIEQERQYAIDRAFGTGSGISELEWTELEKLGRLAE